MKRLTFSFIISLCFFLLAVHGTEPEKTDYTKEKTLFVTGTAHLDTQWRWTIVDTITKYIPATLRDNFKLFEKFSSYVFSFEGAFRYMLMKEYYPDEYKKLKGYIKTGRWAVCGSWVDAVDTHIQSPESLIRQTLYGNGFFKKEFGKSSVDIFLPDCFGFGYVLPSVAAHCGLKGFSSQKLTWGSAIGIPFDLGLWEGVDGSSIIAALNPDDYVATIRADLRESEKWRNTIQKQGEISKLFVGYKYFGVGDEGGAPDEESVSWLEKSIKSDGLFKVLSVPADLMFREIYKVNSNLPRYKGELLMTTHGTGCYTSQAAMKRWNRHNEQMADASERASLVADWLGALPYQAEKIREAWIRFLAHGFHDDITGTSIPEAYTYSWNDEIISMNMFNSIIKNAVGGVVRALDTRTEGIPIVIYNPLAIPRTDIAEAEITLNTAFSGKDLRLLNENNLPVPLQVVGGKDDVVNIVFQAKVPPLGFVVYDLLPGGETKKEDKAPAVLGKAADNDGFEIANDNYQVEIDKYGDIRRIFHKGTQKDILSEPVKLELFNNYSQVWPAWEILYKEIIAAPRAAVASPLRIEVVESGPVRSVIEVERRESGSVFNQRIILPAGDAGDRIEVENIVDWKTRGTLLKASFPLTASNLKATYDLGMGVIERGNNTEKKYEVPAQQWADITSKDGTYGATIITDSKYGWDKPKDNELRLTLIHTPETSGSYKDQATQDIGIHRFKYAIAAHKGDWRSGRIPEIAVRVNQPLIALGPGRHKGTLGRSFSFITVSGEGIAVKALKQAENGDGIIVRVQEQYGRPVKDAWISFATPIMSVKEVNGQEEPVSAGRVIGGKLMFDINPYSPKTFLVTIGKPKVKLEPPASVPVKLEYNLDAVSTNSNMKDGDFDGKGTTFPAELFPESISSDGITFRLGPSEEGMKNVVVCKGQIIPLFKKDWDYNQIYILAAALNGDQSGAFSVGGREFELNIQQYNGFIGQWDSRVVNGEVQKEPELFMPAFIKKDKLAHVSTHLHKSDGTNIPYSFGYIFEYSLPFPTCAKTLRLPDNENIRIFAITVAKNPNMETEPLQELYDSADGAGVVIKASERLFLNSAEFELSSNRNGGEVRYTLDGSEPSKDSPLYSSPVKITETTNIKARVFGTANELENRTASITLEKAALSKAVQTRNVEQGLSFEYYEGNWREIKDMLATKPLTAGVAQDFSMIDGNPKDYFGYRFRGYIEVALDGIYKFHISSDDGSRLIIDGKTVVDNDGLHGAETPETGAIAMKVGLHPVEVLYFNRGWDKSLMLSFTAPDAEKKQVTPAMFYYERNQ